MFRAFGRSILLCAAALTCGAVAAESGTLPKGGESALFSGLTALKTEPGALLDAARRALVAGNVPRAERCLALFRREFPGRSPGLLPFWIGLAANRSEEAWAYLRSVAEKGQGEERFEALSLLAGRAFDEKRYFVASALFGSLDKKEVPAPWRLRGRTGRICCLMNSGAVGEAEQLVNKAAAEFPGEARLWEKYTVWLYGRSGQGRAGDLALYWARVGKNHPPHPDPLLFEGLSAGGAAAVKKRMFAEGERLFADAWKFASNDGERRNCLESLAELQKDHFPRRALRTTDFFLRFYKDEPGRSNMRLVRGEALNRIGEHRQALQVLYEVLNSGNLSPMIRARAALQGAFAAEKISNPSLARELYNSAIRRLDPRRPEAGQAKMQLLEFYLRTGEFDSAAVLGEELSGLPGVDPERLSLCRLQALSKLERYSAAATEAAKLARSKTPALAAEGAWQLARLTELQERAKEARSLYLEFSRKFPGDPRAPDALLAAAGIALRNRDFASAAAEFGSFAQKNPKRSDLRKALWAAIYALLRQGGGPQERQASQLLERLKKEFPGSREYELGLMELVRYRFDRAVHSTPPQDRAEYGRALELLEPFLKDRPKSPEVPQALLLALKISDKTGKHTGTLEYADRILNKFPSSGEAVDAAFFAGSSCFRNGDYVRALKYYERARELGGGGLVSQVAAGEAADCHLQLRKPEDLEAARKIYRELADKSENPAMRAQALFKLGLACEYAKMNRKAIDAYEELLKLGGDSPEARRSAGIGDWCARAARNALRIILSTRDMPEGNQRAYTIHDLYSKLGLPGSDEEISRYRAELDKIYDPLDMAGNSGRNR